MDRSIRRLLEFVGLLFASTQIGFAATPIYRVNEFALLVVVVAAPDCAFRW